MIAPVIVVGGSGLRLCPLPHQHYFYWYAHKVIALTEALLKLIERLKTKPDKVESSTSITPSQPAATRIVTCTHNTRSKSMLYIIETSTNT